MWLPLSSLGTDSCGSPVPRVFSYLSTPVGRSCLRDVFPWLPAEGDAEVDENPCDLLRAVEFMEIADQTAGVGLGDPTPTDAPVEAQYTPEYSASPAASSSSVSAPSPVPSSPRSVLCASVEPTPLGSGREPDPLSATVSAMQAQIQSLTAAFGAFMAAQAHAPATPETGAPAAEAGPSRPPAASGPTRPPVVPAPSASVPVPTPSSAPVPSAPRSLAAVVRSSGSDPRATRAADSLRELSEGDRDRAPSVVHATPESRDTPVFGYGMSALACRQCDLPRASAELAISPMSYGFSQVCRAPRDRGLPVETDRPPFDMVILADPVFQGEILVRRVLYRWARRHNDLDTYGGFQWAYPPPLGIMASDALTVEFPAVPGATYSTVLQPILEWDARRPAPIPGQGLDSRGHPPPRASDYLETFGSRQCARRWRSREIRHIRLWPSNVEPLVDLFFPTGMRPRIRYHRLLLRALCLIAVEPFLRLFACGFLDWARGQVVLTQHRYYWAFLGLFPDGVWADVFLTVDRHDNAEDVSHYQAYLDVLLASRGTYQTDGH
eukprot:jgi/Mesvir1/24412/Mv11077-RA.1